jgi:hypothetical protein
MKKLLLTIAMFLSLSAYAEKSKSDAPLILEYNYVDKAKMKSLTNLENDAEFCCYFEVVNKHNTEFKEDVIRVIDKKSGVCLGVMFGIINKNFIMEVYKKHLTPENIQDIVSKLSKYSSN